MANSEVTLVNPEGKLVYVPEAKLDLALAHGFTQPTIAQSDEVRQREQYGQGLGNEFQAGLEGAGRALTFGGSDLALQALGASKEGLAERKARNPYAEGIGETAGILGGTLATGGLGAVGGAVRGVEALGMGAGRLASAGLAKAGLGEAGSAIAGRALGSALEGSLFGLGQGVSEAALGEPGDTAQMLLAHATMGGLMGGSLGAAAGVLGGVGRSLLAKGSGEREAARLAELAAMGEAPEAAAAAAQPATTGPIRGFAAKVAHVASGADEGALRQMLDFSTPEGAQMRAAAFAGEGVSDDAVRTLTRHIDHAEQEALPVLEQARGKLKDAHIDSIVRKDNFVEQAEAAASTMQTLRDAVTEMRADPANYGNPGVLNKLEKRLDAFEQSQRKRVLAAASGEETGASFSGRTFAEMDDLKANLGQLAKPRKGAMLSAQDYATHDRLQEMYQKTLQPMLEDQELWGKAGELQGRINKKWVKYLEANNLFRNKFMSNVGQQNWQEMFRANPAAIETFLKNAGRARNDLDHELLNSHMDALADFANEAGKVYELDGPLAARVKGVAAAQQGAKKEIGQAVRDSALRNEAAKILETRTGRIVGEAAKLEHTVRSAFGRRGGAPPEFQASPQFEAEAVTQEARDAQIRAMAQAKAKTQSSITKSVASFVEQLKTVPKAALHSLAPAAHEVSFAPLERGQMSDRKDATKRQVKQLALLTADPETFRQRLAESMGDMQQSAPRIAQEMHFQAWNAINYLYANAPKNPYFAATADLRDKWEPSASETRSFARTVRAVNDPLGTLRDMENGRITAEAVHALATVYPTLHRQLISELVPKMAEARGVPLQRRLEVADILGTPLDTLTNPALGATMSAAYATQAKQPAPPARPRVSKNYRAQQSATPLQRALEDLG